MSKYKQLDESLRTWSDQVDGDLSKVSPQQGPFVPRLPVSSTPVRDFGWVRGIGVACVLLLGLFLVRPREVPTDSRGNMLSWQNMYSELSRMFPNQSVWISGIDSEVDMGMKELDSEGNEDRLVLRVALQKQGQGGVWQEVWRRDIVTTEAAWVDTVSQKRPDEKLSVWTYPLAKGVLMLESYLDLPYPYGVKAREQVIISLSGAEPAVNEILIRPGVRMIQTMMEITPSGKKA